MRLRPAILLPVLIGVAISANGELPTELDECVGPGATSCSDSTAILVDQGCGAVFYRYHGCLAWPALRCVGPVTIAVKTRFVEYQNTSYPLYVEVRGRSNPTDSTDCRTGMGGHVVLVAQGGPECGGTWESVGPIDLSSSGVHVGANYSVQCIFFNDLPGPFPGYEPHSVGFACIRVTAHPTTVSPVDWTAVKRLYQ
jgi:hypothetical protein